MNEEQEGKKQGIRKQGARKNKYCKRFLSYKAGMLAEQRNKSTRVRRNGSSSEYLTRGHKRKNKSQSGRKSLAQQKTT